MTCDAMKYKSIYVAVDGSAASDAAARYAVLIGSKDGGVVYGSHVYAARLHERRFKMMEGGLPEQYREETALENQRQVHDSLITRGLQLISDSYLAGMKTLCEQDNVPFHGISLEGKNWQELVKDITVGTCDLVVLGAHGVGRVAASALGTVAERVIRRVRRDVFICRKSASENNSDSIVVCVDGSSRSWGALLRGIRLADAFGKKVVAVSCFDPHFHYTMFNSINRILTDKARAVFKFEEQERMHEDIIDSGLATMYQSYLDIARRIGADEGVDVSTHLLAGKAYEKIVEFISQTSPWLTIVGRIGSHSDEDMDIGGNTENICRLAECNVLVVETKHQPKSEYVAEATVVWTREASERVESIPPPARDRARKMIQNYCVENLHTVVTSSIVDDVVGRSLPGAADGSEALEAPHTNSAMGAGVTPLWTDAAVRCLERVPQGFMRTAARMSVERHAKQAHATEITLDVAEAGLAAARERMVSAMKSDVGAQRRKDGDRQDE